MLNISICRYADQIDIDDSYEKTIIKLKSRGK